MKRLATIVLVLTAAAASFAGEIDYIEDFSLAKDRTVPLGQLIPGTEDYFYYHALHHQNNGQFAKVDELLKPWIKEHKYTSRVREILNRQALLKYEKDPQTSLEYIREQLGIQFNHQREVLGKKPDLPTALDQKLFGQLFEGKRDQNAPRGQFNLVVIDRCFFLEQRFQLIITCSIDIKPSILLDRLLHCQPLPWRCKI